MLQFYDNSMVFYSRRASFSDALKVGLLVFLELSSERIP